MKYNQIWHGIKANNNEIEYHDFFCMVESIWWRVSVVTYDIIHCKTLNIVSMS